MKAKEVMTKASLTAVVRKHGTIYDSPERATDEANQEGLVVYTACSGDDGCDYLWRGYHGLDQYGYVMLPERLPDTIVLRASTWTVVDFFNDDELAAAVLPRPGRSGEP